MGSSTEPTVFAEWLFQVFTWSSNNNIIKDIYYRKDHFSGVTAFTKKQLNRLNGASNYVDYTVIDKLTDKLYTKFLISYDEWKEKKFLCSLVLRSEILAWFP